MRRIRVKPDLTLNELFEIFLPRIIKRSVPVHFFIFIILILECYKYDFLFYISEKICRKKLRQYDIGIT